MTSAFGWIDFSSEHREKVRSVIDLLSTPGVIDELGIGVIRDAFSDSLFPGISTVQTRPKYFTLTALLLKRYAEALHSNKRLPPLEEYLEKEEKRCRIQLVRTHEDDPDALGIIGSNFGQREDRTVVRGPCSIYWAGLRRFGMVSPIDLSFREFGRRISDPRYRLQRALRDGGDDDLSESDEPASCIRVLAPPVDDAYWDHLSISLTREEAEFLRLQILAHSPTTLIGRILLDDAVSEEILALRRNSSFEQFADLPFLKKLPHPELRTTVEHARDFWKIFRGAYIRYNCLLQARFGTSDGAAMCNEQWKSWREELPSVMRRWETSVMWRVVAAQTRGVKQSTRRFVNAWIEECRQGAEREDECDELIRRQEIHNKGKRARFRPDNQDAVNHTLGLTEMEFRFPQAWVLIRDIRDALVEGDRNHA